MTLKLKISNRYHTKIHLSMLFMATVPALAEEKEKSVATGSYVEIFFPGSLANEGTIKYENAAGDYDQIDFQTGFREERMKIRQAQETTQRGAGRFSY